MKFNISKISRVGEKIKGFFKRVGKGIKNVATKVGKGIWNGMKWVWNKIGSFMGIET